MELRLFPLSRVVLFPGMSLSLQVFEQRYRQLVAECLQADEPFGVALIREGVEVGGPAITHDVGTTARITTATVAPDGMLHLDAIGMSRFRVLSLHDDRAYLWADVELLPADEGGASADLADGARIKLLQVQRLRATAAGGFEREPRVPREPGALADAIGALSSAPPVVLQALLETLDPGARLQAAMPLLDELLEESEQAADAAAALRWRSFGRTN